MTPPDNTHISGADAARRLAGAEESSIRLQGSVSAREGWLTITSAALAFVMIAGALRTGRGVGYGFVLVTTPVAILLARSRRSAVRVHPRKYHRSYSMATVWCLIVAVAAYWYWVLRDPKGPPLWLTTAVALVAAVPLALVGQRLVGGGRSR